MSEQEIVWPSRRAVAIRAAALFVMIAVGGAVACSDDASDPEGIGGAGGAGGSAAGGSSLGGSAGIGGTAGIGGAPGSAGAATASCPPAGPFGNQVGDVAPDVTLYDCDGNPVRLHDLCEHKATFVYTFAGWCPTCKGYASSGRPNETWQTYKDDDFGMLFVVTSPASSGTPTEETCRNYRDQYGLQMPVLFDPDGVTQSVLSMKVNSGDLVLSHGSVVELNTSSASAAESTLESLYGY